MPFWTTDIIRMISNFNIYEKKMLQNYFLVLFIALAVAGDVTELGGFQNDLERIGRQFSAIGDRAKAEGDANVAMSLVDALQKWADALEQQISLMRMEMVGLKTNNNQLADKVSVLERDNGRLSGEIGRMSLKLDEVTGKISNVGEDVKQMEGLKDDVVVMSSTFNQFIDHFQNYSLRVMSNYSFMNDQLEVTSSSYTSLKRTMELMASETKLSMSALSSDLESVTTQVLSMESGLVQYKNLTLVRIETIEKEMSHFTDTMVNRTMIEKLVTHISDELNEIHIVTASNFTNMSNELKVMGTAFHHTLYNASVLIFNDVEDIKKNVENLNSDIGSLKKVDDRVKKDILRYASDLENLSNNNDDKWKSSELKILKANKDLESFSTKLADLYNASVSVFNNADNIKKSVENLYSEIEVLKKFDDKTKQDYLRLVSDLENLSNNNDDKWKSNEIKILKANKDLESLSTKLVELSIRVHDSEALLPKINVTFSSLFNSLRFNLTQLDLTSNSLRSGMFKLEAKIMTTEQALQTNSNTSLVILGKLRRFEDLDSQIFQLKSDLKILEEMQVVLTNNATTLKGHVKTLELGLFELGSITKRGEVNNTQLQMSYRNLEKHFVEFKRELFEANMELVSLNVTLGDVRQDIVAVGQAVANTTHFLTSKLEEVSDRSSVFKHEMGIVANQTLFVDEKLIRFMNNQTHSTSSMFNSMLKLKDEIVKFHNKTNYLEMGMAGLMNFSLEMDSSLRVVQQNLTFCVHSISEITSNATDTTIRLYQMSEISSHHSQLLLEYSQNLEGNITKLSLADNLLETELSRIISGYKGLKLTMSNHLHSIGGLEEGIRVLSQDSEAWKTNLDTLKFELDSIKSETTSVNVFFNTMQGHISALSSNISGVITNVTFCMDEIEDSKLHVDTLTSEVDDLKGNMVKFHLVLQDKDSKFDEHKINITNIKSNLVGLGNYINSINGDLSQLLVNFDSYTKKMSTNISSVMTNITFCLDEIEDSKLHINSLTSDVDDLKVSMDKVHSVIHEKDSKFDEHKINITSIKTNLIGLGNNINNINGDLNQLLVSFDTYAKKMSTEMTTIKSNISEVFEETITTRTVTTKLKEHLESIEFVSSSMKDDINGLTSKFLNVKTSLFEQTNEMTTMKASYNLLQSLFEKMETKVIRMADKEKHMDEMMSEFGVVKTGFSSLKNSILSIQSQIEVTGPFGGNLDLLSGNISSIRADLNNVNKDLLTIKPEIFSLSSDIANFRESIHRIGKSSFDPDRFSCAVTSDEIRTPGVITYSVCNINSNDIVNPSTGHLTALQSGDYFISFSANLVSVKSQAIWCALYKQSASKDGWEVIGMINNYQREAGPEDDRDSGSISLITHLENGDQVWVEWRGYGESFLYSNPYRLISFTGFLLNKKG